MLLRDSLQHWVASVVTGEVTIELRRGDDYTILDTTGEAVTYDSERLSMERSATAFTAADRIGQLAVQINDIADTRRMLERHGHVPLEEHVTLWSGRVGAELAPEVWEFLKADDAELLPYDVQGTLLHAERLHAAGILDDGELAEVRETLGRLDTVDPAAEDVHSFIEAELGEVGRKIHAGRSRNDQVAAAFRLYVADACVEADGALAAFARAILERAAEDAETPMPGYTHLQRAQPVTLGHHLLAWSEMLERDRARFAFAAAQAAPSPLGAGALAGSTLPLPPPPQAMRNSLDAVADRDFALDYLYAAAVLFTHLSRISEELVLWTTAEFGFARLPEDAATGSSMMPQKLNPDVAELARGKAGTAIGRLTGPARDDQGPSALLRPRPAGGQAAGVRRAARRRGRARRARACSSSGLEFDRERLAQAASDPLLLATDAAEALVREGVPFRDAHEQVAASVRAGTFEPPRAGQRLPDVGAAVAAALERWS